jgi:hypothetical protein
VREPIAKSPERSEPIWDLRASIKMRNAVFTTSDGGAVLGENGEIAE